MRRLPVLAAVTILGSACALTAIGTAHAATGHTVLPGSIPGTTPGYDDVTGLGTPTSSFLAALSS